MRAPQPTLEVDGISNTNDGADAEPRDSTHGLDADAASTPRTRAEEIDATADGRTFESQHPNATGVVGSTADKALPAPGNAPAPTADVLLASTTAHEIAATPSFTLPARDTTLPPRTARWQWVALALLALTLALQVLLADRARLAADAQWRPLLTSLCGAFGCSLPTWHEPDAFTMLSRDVRPVQGATGALLVHATFRNDARWAQAWPVMKLSLSDADGRIVGARAFVPSEYLDAATTQTVLAPGQSAQIMLQVREPEASVVAFSFDFD